ACFYLRVKNITGTPGMKLTVGNKVLIVRYNIITSEIKDTTTVLFLFVEIGFHRSWCPYTTIVILVLFIYGYSI
ncbi:MAG: hypothetical protein ACRCZO_18140, partial [Cetobacterium sp.]